MNLDLTETDARKFANDAVLAILGFAIGYAILAETMSFPVVGDVSGNVIGGLALVVALVAYRVRKNAGSCDCC